MNNEIIIYQTEKLTSRIEVRIEDETVWLNRLQIASLFDRDVKTIGKHINNVFSEGELEKIATVANFATVQNEGGRKVERQIEFYNLDVIISVGYRVKSKQGTQFRIWANRILKDYLLKGYSLNQRMNRIEGNMFSIMKKVDEIDIQINANLPHTQGVFFNGEVFDAYTLMANIVRSVKKTIVLIDNYIDDTVLTHLCKKKPTVSAILLTKSIGKQLQLDVEKANTQYPSVKVKEFKDAHDRFLIIDEKEVYHIGASLKDLGKKWFAFSKMDVSSVKTLDKLKKGELV
ncbi:MAG: virulence RhuM family protein [Melioribacteraceae bacterium]|nr:virulence RhuM family protein [Melioribacteraceae bacterium]